MWGITYTGARIYHTKWITIYSIGGAPIHIKDVIKAQLINDKLLEIIHTIDGTECKSEFYTKDYMGITHDNTLEPTFEKWESY